LDSQEVALEGLASIAAVALLHAECSHSIPFLMDNLRNWPLAATAIFLHNVLAASALMLCMIFLASLLVPPEGHKISGAWSPLVRPETLSAAIAAAIVLASLLRGAIFAHTSPQDLPTMIMYGLPVMLMEGYGLYLGVRGALTKRLKVKTLLQVYAILLATSVIEVGLLAPL